MKYIKIYEDFKVKKLKLYSEIDNGGKASIVNAISPSSKHKKIKKKFSSLFKDIVNEFNLDEKKVKFIGSGSFGMAFSIGSDKIIKITSNDHEAAVARNLVGKRRPGCVEYYRVLYLEDYDLYVILMDKTVLPSEFEKPILAYLIETKSKDADRTIRTIKKTFDIGDAYAKSLYTQVFNLKRNLKKSQVKTSDLHDDNVGYLNGELVHFDVMINDGVEAEITKLEK